VKIDKGRTSLEFIELFDMKMKGFSLKIVCMSTAEFL